MDFSYASLRRFPDVEAPNLQAWDATDELLVRFALAADVAGDEIAVIGDEYGAITLALADAGRSGVRVHQDSATGRRALTRNAAEFGVTVSGRAVGSGGADVLEGAGISENRDGSGVSRRVGIGHADEDGPDPGFPHVVPHELGHELLAGARLVLLQLPKSLAELEEISDAVARWAAPDVTLVAGGRVKHMTLAQNDVLGRGFDSVQAQRAERKSRLVVATQSRAVSAEPPYPVTAQAEVPGLDRHLTIVAHGGAFAGARLDIGTRVLLEVLASRAQLRRNMPDGSGSDGEDADLGKSSGVVHAGGLETVVDLGCGTGILAATYGLTHPDASIIATDRSASAAASARATLAANGVHARVTHDDAGSEIPDRSADLVLLNPPFHLGSSIHAGAASRLFGAAARILKPGGELLTVYNAHLGYRHELTRRIGPTEQLRRTPKFVVTRSVRR